MVAETWTLKAADEKKLTAFELWTYRHILRISYFEKEKRMSMFLIQLAHHPSLPNLSFRGNSGTLVTSQEQPVHLNSGFFKQQPMAEEAEEGRELAGWTISENGRGPHSKHGNFSGC